MSEQQRITELLRDLHGYIGASIPQTISEHYRGCDLLDRIDAVLAGKLPDHFADVSNMVELDAYDAGHLNDYGGGNVGWWHDYIRSELNRAHDFYQSQFGEGNHTEQTLAMVPEGWQLVPVEPTENMIGHGCGASVMVVSEVAKAWGAMLAAAQKPECWCRTCRPVTMSDMRFVVCPDCGNKRCPRANDHRNACTGSNEPGQPGSASHKPDGAE
ncbi:hypothetical protein M8828_01145 [Aeromonas simiae]|uniref:hypothetical protein n=1 Tax=Aeromonas simiae TaxID=218936 RepID=UPI00266C0C10|nr:hypothetical protein [Aeromonas simiae]MDO2946978.1 hypothetical protein [Aeromonas simiae]MDO2954428.1 hypothetical protein [Aeromonas simiae]